MHPATRALKPLTGKKLDTVGEFRFVLGSALMLCLLSGCLVVVGGSVGGQSRSVSSVEASTALVQSHVAGEVQNDYLIDSIPLVEVPEFEIIIANSDKDRLSTIEAYRLMWNYDDDSIMQYMEQGGIDFNTCDKALVLSVVASAEPQNTYALLRARIEKLVRQDRVELWQSMVLSASAH